MQSPYRCQFDPVWRFYPAGRTLLNPQPTTGRECSPCWHRIGCKDWDSCPRQTLNWRWPCRHVATFVWTVHGQSLIPWDHTLKYSVNFHVISWWLVCQSNYQRQGYVTTSTLSVGFNYLAMLLIPASGGQVIDLNRKLLNAWFKTIFVRSCNAYTE